MKNVWGFALMIVSGIAYAFGGTILKKAAVDFRTDAGFLAAVGRLLVSKFFWISLVCSVSGYVLYFFLIRKAEVITTTLVIQGILFVATMFFASLLFREAITPSKILATVLIMAGIAVLAVGK